jgi:4-carboxymuconolactone decarboxylase
MPRLPPLDPAALDAGQRAVYDRIASGARGGVGGPFIPLLQSAELAGRVEQLGLYIRFQCTVPERLRELAILVVSQHWKARYEWYAHGHLAQKQGVPDTVTAAVGAGTALPAETDPADRTVVEFCRALLREGRVSDASMDAANALLGTKGAVELTGLVGYYSLLAMQLNAFEIEPPPGRPIPF